MNELIKTIEDELPRLGLNKRDFCKVIKEEPQTYNNWRQRGIPGNKLAKVAKYMGWNLKALSEGRIETGGSENTPASMVLSGDADENAIGQIVEILIETQAELMAEGVLSEPYDAKMLGKMAKQAYKNALKNHELNPKSIKEGIRFAALLNA